MTQWQLYNEKFDSLSQREKVLALVAGLAVVFMVGLTYGIEPLIKDNRAMRSEIILLEGQIQSLELQKQTYESAISIDPNAEYEVQLERLKQRISNIEIEFADEISQLVPPTAMPALMATMLGLSDNLVLNEMTALEPVNIFAERPVEEELALYQHGVQMHFSGSYADAQAFLARLEETEWQVYWRVMNFDVESYPDAVLSIEFYTLSTEKVFIRV